MANPVPRTAAGRALPYGEQLYRRWWHIHWKKGNSLTPQWEQLQPSQQRTWIELGEAEAAASPAAPAVDRPRIVCLCGSTRFYEEFQQANYDETMAGRIVLSVGFYPHAKAQHGHGEGVGHDSSEKVALDELHKRKIDLADEVLVLDVEGYIGESTRSEIDYAIGLGKPIRYLSLQDTVDQVAT